MKYVVIVSTHTLRGDLLPLWMKNLLYGHTFTDIFFDKEFKYVFFKTQWKKDVGVHMIKSYLVGVGVPPGIFLVYTV